jgi:hypothetical protein
MALGDGIRRNIAQVSQGGTGSVHKTGRRARDAAPSPGLMSSGALRPPRPRLSPARLGACRATDVATPIGAQKAFDTTDHRYF